MVDLFICSETIEHLDNPSETLKLVRQHTNKLFISTPVDKFDDHNLEHYWAWDFEGISDTLTSAGFVIKEYERLELSQNYYTFALVYCE
jgi:2-polyprenyl-3-methyl-5-hydroxy-6-metoxy-1,4-benzoquinol methylase